MTPDDIKKDAFERVPEGPYRSDGRTVRGPDRNTPDAVVDLLPDDMAARLHARSMNEAFRLGYRAALMEKA